MDSFIAAVARVCHEANRSYCQSLGDFSQAPWREAPLWQLQSAIDGVKAVVDDPTITPEKSHENWMAKKLADGWKYGPEKNEELKTHPAMQLFHALPRTTQAKDHIFIGIAKAMIDIKLEHDIGQRPDPDPQQPSQPVKSAVDRAEEQAA